MLQDKTKILKPKIKAHLTKFFVARENSHRFSIKYFENFPINLESFFF